jgi:thiamine kinase-like enzyme
LNILCGTKPDDSIDNTSLRFIDYEYGEYNFLGFEIAMYFNEGCFDLTETVYPFYSHIDDSDTWEPTIKEFAFYYLAYKRI